MLVSVKLLLLFYTNNAIIEVSNRLQINMTSPELSTTSNSQEAPKGDYSEFEEGMKQAALAYQATLEKIQDKYDDGGSINEDLIRLYKDGDKIGLDKMVDDIADEAMENHPNYTELINKIKEARANGQDVTEYAAQIDELKSHFVEVVVSMAGLPDEERFTEIEQARERIGQLINENVSEKDRHDLNAIYKALNILVTDEKTGKFTYRFPEEIMPESINKKWGTYLASVYKHLQSAENNRSRLAGVEEGRDNEKWFDLVRKNDHDSLTTDFHAVIDIPEEDGWDNKTARALLATIRDRMYPTLGSLEEKNSDERKHAERQLVENLDGVLVGELLASKHHS